MTAVIRNKAPYIVKCRGPFILSFVLGHDVSLRCVLGLPTLLFIRTAINLLSGELAYTELDRTFPLTLDPPGKGLPDDAALNRCSSSIPPDVPINTISTTSLLQCTSSDGSLNPSWRDTPLDNIVVKDHFFKWCFPWTFFRSSDHTTFEHSEINIPLTMLLFLAHASYHGLIFFIILLTHLFT